MKNKVETELSLLADADKRAHAYLETVKTRRAFPTPEAIMGLSALSGELPLGSTPACETLAILDDIGTPATVTSNGPNYYGFVIGAVLPVAAAADRLAAAWDQCASSHTNSPVMASIEKTAGKWLLDILDLPENSGVGFGTSATACGLSCFGTARRTLLKNLGWDLDQKGLTNAPTIRVIVSKKTHITIIKALKLLGFGLDNIIYAPADAHGRIIVDKLPLLDAQTILCLQAGEVNTGEFDDFASIIPKAKKAGAWVHVDGAFGLWARASKKFVHLTKDVDLADSWTTDGHKWLNTPYDSAVAICRDKTALAQTLNADAVYSHSEADAQKNLTLEFSRKARGLGFWAVMHSLGREGIEKLVDQYCERTTELAAGCKKAGITVLNRVVLNQILCRLEDDEHTLAFIKAVQSNGKVWFGPTIWEGRPAFRLSVSSWRIEKSDIENCIAELKRHI